jgi:hypothetical protein
VLTLCSTSPRVRIERGDTERGDSLTGESGAGGWSGQRRVYELMTSSQSGRCERLPTGWEALISEEEWTAIAPWFIGRPELRRELHTIIREMSLPCRRSFLAHLGERHDACLNRRATRQILAAIASTHAESPHGWGSNVPRRCVPSRSLIQHGHD